MKKVLTVFLLVAMCFTFVGCNNIGAVCNCDPDAVCKCGEITSNDQTSVRVQSITYTDGEETISLTSRFRFEYTEEYVGKYTDEEYEDAIEKCYTSGIIEVNGTVKNQSDYVFNDGHTPEQLSDYVGKTYYVHYLGYYKKITYTAVHISYLDVTFISDDTFEVSYYDYSLKDTLTLRIKTDNYKIVYFSKGE